MSTWPEAETFEPHMLNTTLPALRERAVGKNAKGTASPTVWDYSEQTRILGHFIRASLGSTLSERLIGDVVAVFKP